MTRQKPARSKLVRVNLPLENRPEFRPPLEHNRPNNRVDRYVGFLRKRLPNKDRYNDLALAYEREPIDLEQLSNSPLFEFGPGFYDPQKSLTDREPSLAPYEAAEMRLLLARVLPASMIPFFQERVVFEFSDQGDPNHPMGPIVTIDQANGSNNQKIKFIFYRPNFFTEGSPQSITRSKDKNQREHARYIARFLDPAKVTMLVGKMVSKLIPPPKVPTDWKDIVDKKFSITKNKTNKKSQKKPPKLNEKQRTEAQLIKQWEDFIGLAMVSPDAAQQKYPEAFKYFQDQTTKFNDISNDQVAFNRLAEAQSNGQLEFQDIVIDHKSINQEDSQSQFSPQLRWYEKFINTLNRGFLPFGYKLTYKLPNDPERAALLAEDDKEIKHLIETMDEEGRDKEFGELLGSAKNFDELAKNKSRRYLLAASQAGEFAEWRIWAWLVKFSKKFHDSKGLEISEDEYKDLQLIYTQSDKVGNRIGTGVLPFKSEEISKEDRPEAKYYGRKVYVYVRKDRADYIKEVEKKVRAKTDRAIMEASEKVFDQFKTAGGYLDFNASYDSTPNGMSVPTGNLDQLLGDALGKEVAESMSRAGITKIPPDAKAAAMAYYDYYKAIGRVRDKNMKPIALDIIRRYEKDLNSPPEEKVKALTSIPAGDIVKTGDVSYIYSQSSEANEVKKQILTTIDIAGKQWLESGRLTASTLHGITVADKSDPNNVKEKQFQGILPLISAGNTNPNLIYSQAIDLINVQFQHNPTLAQQEARNVFAFLNQKQVKQNLQLMETTVAYERQLAIPYLDNLQAVATEVRSNGDLIVTKEPDSTTPNKKSLEMLARYKIIDLKQYESTEARIKTEEIKDADGNIITEASEVIDQVATEQKKRDYIKSQISLSQPEAITSLTYETIGMAIASLDLDLYTKNNANEFNYVGNFDHWLENDGQIFQAIALSKPRSDLQKAINLMSSPATLQLGLQQKNKTTEAMNRALHFERYALEARKKGPKKQLKIDEDD